MRTYQYELRDQSGLCRKGVIRAPSEDGAREIAASQGEVLSLAPRSGSAAGLFARLRGLRVESGPSRREVLMFAKQLSIMSKAGIGIRDALSGMLETMRVCRLRTVLELVLADVEGGVPFSTAIAAHPKIFGPSFVHMSRAAEMSGTMGDALERIAEDLGQEMETRAIVRAAMVYPIVMCVVAVVAIVFLLTFALPKFAVIFERKAAVLPTPTIVLLGLSAFLRSNWHILIGAGVGVAVAFRMVTRSRWGRPRWDAVKLRIPVIRDVLRSLYISRSLRTLGVLVDAGTPVLDGLGVSGDICANVQYRGMWRSVAARVEGGSKIAVALRDEPLMPPEVTQMIAAAEASGSLGKVLKEVGAFYAGELRAKVKILSTMIEPLMIVAMGVIVGFIAMSVILPIFKMSSLVK